MDLNSLPGWLTNKEFLLILLPALTINLLIDASKPFVENWPIKNKTAYNTIMCLGGILFALLHYFCLGVALECAIIQGLGIPVISYILYKADIWELVKQTINKFVGK